MAAKCAGAPVGPGVRSCLGTAREALLLFAPLQNILNREKRAQTCVSVPVYANAKNHGFSFFSGGWSFITTSR